MFYVGMILTDHERGYVSTGNQVKISDREYTKPDMEYERNDTK